MRYRRRRFPNGNLHPISAQDNSRRRTPREIDDLDWPEPKDEQPPPLVQAIRAMKNAILWLIGSVVFLGLLVFLLWYK